MREVFAEYRPSIVFHAAAYKHVALMEANAVEAIRNNALATRLVAELAGETAAGSFVLVSTDKAVDPATVMGASKALAELAIEAAASRHPQTAYAAVRFGNVLGSSGSVVPIFRRQIERGGPVTVTDERMTRYFMTIAEAVHLILRSGALAGQDASRTFVLDMGEPVKILDLAREMIELSGLEPGRDIEIDIIGARHGEKLDERLFNDWEQRGTTDAEKIFLAERPALAPRAIEAIFAEVAQLVEEGDADQLAHRVGDLMSGLRAPAAPGAKGANAAGAPAALVHSQVS